MAAPGTRSLGLSTIIRREVESLELYSEGRAAMTASSQVRMLQSVSTVRQLLSDLGELIARYQDDAEKLERFLRLKTLLESALGKFSEIDFEYNADAPVTSAATGTNVFTAPESSQSSDDLSAATSALRLDGGAAPVASDSEESSETSEEEDDDDATEPEQQIQCCLCWDDKDWDDTRALSPCNHRVCTDCLRQHAVLKINEADIFGLTCPYAGCDTQLKVEQLQSILSRELFDKLLRFSFIAAVRADEKGKICPAPGCDYAGFMEPSAIKPGSNGKVDCPTCRESFCYHCQIPWMGHEDRNCEDAKRWRDEYSAKESTHDAQFQIWMLEQGGETHSRPCPKCKFYTEKNGGCNHMSCSKCQHQWCWICGGDYNAGRHFTGSWDTGCCQFGEPPDWEQRKQRARAEAEKARKKLTAKPASSSSSSSSSAASSSAASSSSSSLSSPSTPKKKKLFCTHQ